MRRTNVILNHEMSQDARSGDEIKGRGTNASQLGSGLGHLASVRGRARNGAGNRIAPLLVTSGRTSDRVCWGRWTSNARPASVGNTSGRLAQLVRAPHSHCGGHWFESSIAHWLKLLTGVASTRISRIIYGARYDLTRMAQRP